MYPRIWRGEPSALRSDIAPGGMGKMHFYLNFSCLSMNVFDMHGISVAESIVSWCSILSSSKNTGDPNSCGWETCRVRGNIKYIQLVENASGDLKKIHYISSRPSLLAVAGACYL